MKHAESGESEAQQRKGSRLRNRAWNRVRNDGRAANANILYVADILQGHIEIWTPEDIEGDEGERPAGQSEVVLSVWIKREQSRCSSAIGELNLGKQIRQRVSSMNLLIDRIDVEDQRGKRATFN